MSEKSCDVLIREGTIFDGTGNPGFKGDLAIAGGNVIATGRDLPHKAAKEIDAKGCWVTPGFLDIHTHYDAEVEVLPGLTESVRHGVTTVIFGNCSLSAAVGAEQEIIDLFCRVESLPRDLMEEWLSGKITWSGPREYYEHLDTLPLGPNVASFLGHSNVRIRAMGMERSLTEPKATKQEIEAMQAIVQEAIDAGYLGLSVDMLPWHRMDGEAYKGISVPSQQAAYSEYRALADVVRKANRVLQATPNALMKKTVVQLIALSTGLMRQPLRTTMVAAMDVKTDRKVWRMATMLATIANKLLNANFRWQALADPFLNYADGVITPLFEEFPVGVRLISATREQRGEMLRDPKIRKDFREQWQDKHQRVFHRNLGDMWVVSSPDPEHAGKSIEAIAKVLEQDPLECFMDLLAQYDTDFRWKTIVSNDRDLPRRMLLAHPTTLPGFNDSGAHNRNMAFHDGALKMLQQVYLNPGTMHIERAVHRLSGETAKWLGLQIGEITDGSVADVVVIDPDKLRNGLSDPIEHADADLDHQMRMVKRSDGVVRNVLIGGKVAFEDGNFADDFGKEKYGRLLRAAN